MAPSLFIIIGLLLTLAGLVLVYFSGTALWHRYAGAAGLVDTEEDLDDVEEDDPQESEPSLLGKGFAGLLGRSAGKEDEPAGEQDLDGDRLAKLKTYRRPGRGSKDRQVSGLEVPMDDMNLVLFERWAGSIANNLYIRCTDDDDRRVSDFLYPDVRETSKIIEDPARLKTVRWVMLFINSELQQSLYNNQGIDLEELRRRLLDLIQPCLRPSMSPELFAQFRPHLQIFVADKEVLPGHFQLAFYPLPDESESFLTVDGAVSLYMEGRTNMPGCKGRRYRIGDRDFDGTRHLPLKSDTNREFTIGSFDWCHLVTGRSVLEGMVTLAWQPRADRDSAASLAVLEYRSKDRLFFELPGFKPLRLDKMVGSAFDVPISEGSATVVALIREREGKRTQIGDLVLTNPAPDLGRLPETWVGRDIPEEDPEHLAEIIATRIYLDSRFRPGADGPLLLSEPGGARFLEDRLGALNQIVPLTDQDQLCFRVRLVASPGFRRSLQARLGVSNLSTRLAERTKQVLKHRAPYNQLFAESALACLDSGENKPGLQVEIAADETVPSGNLMIRVFPPPPTDPRTDIFGMIDFSAWPGAQDNSGLSCKPQEKNFLVHFPKGFVGMRISRFPLYGIKASGIRGWIGLTLEEPAGPGARLAVSNRSRDALFLDGERIAPEADREFPVGVGNHRLTLTMGNRAMTIHLFDHAKEAAEVPDFMPSPGRLQLVGTTLARRLKGSGFQDSSFQKQWEEAATRQDLVLEGVAQITSKGYLTALVRESVKREIHYFGGERTEISDSGWADTIPAGSSTLALKPLAFRHKIEEIRGEGSHVVHYHRTDFRAGLEGIENAGLLLDDHFDRWADAVESELDDDLTLMDVDIFAVGEAIGNVDDHLYLFTYQNGTGTIQGGLFNAAGRLPVVVDASDRTVEIAADSKVCSGLDINQSYRVRRGEEERNLVFGLPSHQEQVETYLTSGWFSYSEGKPYCPGGNLASGSKPFEQPAPLIIRNKTIALQYKENALDMEGRLNFNPKTAANYYDQDGFRLGYDPESREFKLTSRQHIKRGVTPKSVFLIVTGTKTILGSHALNGVVIPHESCYLVLPGCVFSFDRGPRYQGYNY